MHCVVHCTVHCAVHYVGTTCALCVPCACPACARLHWVAELHERPSRASVGNGGERPGTVHGIEQDDGELEAPKRQLCRISSGAAVCRRLGVKHEEAGEAGPQRTLQPMYHGGREELWRQQEGVRLRLHSCRQRLEVFGGQNSSERDGHACTLRRTADAPREIEQTHARSGTIE